MKIFINMILHLLVLVVWFDLIDFVVLFSSFVLFANLEVFLWFVSSVRELGSSKDSKFASASEKSSKILNLIVLQRNLLKILNLLVVQRNLIVKLKVPA